MIGSLCAIWLRNPVRANSPPSLAMPAQLAGLAGIVLIVVSVMTMAEDMPLPGIKGLVPTVGAALIILYAREGTWAARILSFLVFVGIGLISYSLYLWHYPVFVFYRYYSALSLDAEYEFLYHIPTVTAWWLMALSFVLAIITYFVIEQPFRKRRIDGWPALFGLAACYAVAAVYSLVAYKTDTQERFYLSQTLGVEQAEIDLHTDHFSRFNWLGGLERLGDGDCVFVTSQLDDEMLQRFSECRDKHGPGTLLMGDSHAENLHNILDRMAPESRFQVTLARDGCSLWRKECFFDLIEERLFASREGYFASVYYHQLGGSLILDSEGDPDDQDAFMDPANAMGVWHERIDQGVAWLARVQGQYGYDVTWIGAYYEPRINSRRYQHLLKGWEPRPTVLPQFIELDEALGARARAAGIGYISMMQPELVFSESLIVDDCLMYRDLDHFTPCGEQAMARAISQSGHPLLRLVDRQGGETAAD